MSGKAGKKPIPLELILASKSALTIIFYQLELFYADNSALKQQGAQIDLVIDRRDQVINLCEMKFSINPYIITKEYAGELAIKIAVFQEQTGTKKSIYLTLITTFGLVGNSYSSSMVRNSLDMNVLFT